MKKTEMKNGNSKMSLKVLSLMLIAAVNGAAAYAGTGVGGGGGPDARSQYLAKLALQIGPRLSLRGPHASLGDSVSEWCSRIAAVLRREQVRAENQYGRGHKTQAKQILVDAMLSATQSIDGGEAQSSPITKLLLDRGLMISQALDDALAQGQALALSTEINFLDQYVGFVIRKQEELDVPYYVPYVYRYGSCGEGHCPSGFGVEEFERQYLKYAAEQIEFTYRHFTEVSLDDHGVPRVYPIGDARAFLKVGELVSGWVAQDLAISLFAAREACVAQDLNELSGELAAFNDSGDRSVFATVPQAVSDTRVALENLAAHIPIRGCERGPYFEPRIEQTRE